MTKEARYRWVNGADTAACDVIRDGGLLQTLPAPPGFSCSVRRQRQSLFYSNSLN